MGRGKKIVWKCDVCDHEWVSRKGNKPICCAKCKTPYWDSGKKK